MVALRIYANENKTKYNYFICINSAKENVENNTDIFESTKLMLGRKTLDYVDGSLDINTSTTRQMPLRIMLLGVDAYNHTEETLNEIYQLGRSSLQVPYLDKSQSVSFNLNNKKYKASNEIDELGRISRKEFTVDNVTKFYKNYTYNKTRPTEEVDKNSLITTYTYDDMGNIITKSNINKSYAYGYDSLNRLVSEQTNDYTINYLYNSNGNMHTKTVIKGNDTINYTYRYSSNSLIKITKEVNGEVVNEDNITYNKLYPIKINNVDYEWDNNNLIRIGTNTYEYNSSNIRTKKTVGTKVYTYTLDNTNIIKEHILDITNNIDVTLEYIYDANNTLVGVIENENIYYYDRDITGLILGLVDTNGNYVVKYTYTAYGEVEKDILVNTNISTYNPFMYKGYYYDVETQLYWVSSRYYSPELCRFIQPADVSSLNALSINGLNLYSYANNNPVGIVYSSFNGVFGDNGGTIGAIGKTKLSLNSNVSNNSLSFDPNFIGNLFAHNENVFSTGAGIVEGIRRSKGLSQLEALSTISKVLMHAGYWLNVGLSAYNNFTNEELSCREQWVSFSVDTIHNTGQTVGSYFLGVIPYAGPFLAIGVPIIVDYLWLGELCILGFDLDFVPAIIIEGKTPEEWVKYWINSWFE